MWCDQFFIACSFYALMILIATLVNRARDGYVYTEVGFWRQNNAADPNVFTAIEAPADADKTNGAVVKGPLADYWRQLQEAGVVSTTCFTVAFLLQLAAYAISWMLEIQAIGEKNYPQ